MEVEIIKRDGTWRDVADAARATVGMGRGDGEPPERWKRSMLLAEHSPIRLLRFTWEWRGLPYFVSVHLVRHKFGVEHFVSTQRTDRTGVERDGLRQDAPVTHRCAANAQAIISMSRKRLCAKADPATRRAWRAFVAALREADPAVADACVPECVYRGFCPERRGCGFRATEEWAGWRERYTGEGK